MVESYAVTVDQGCSEHPLSRLIAPSYCLTNMNASFAQILSAESITPSWQRPVWLKHPDSLSLCCVRMSHCPKVSHLVVVICCKWRNSSMPYLALCLMRRMACRCFWDSDTDNYAQDIYMNVSAGFMRLWKVVSYVATIWAGVSISQSMCINEKQRLLQWPI